MAIYGLGVRSPTPFEIKIFSWFFFPSVLLTLISYLILSETDVKKCRKVCKEKGYNFYIYTPSDDYGIIQSKCECCNKIRDSLGTVRLKDGECVNLND